MDRPKQAPNPGESEATMRICHTAGAMAGMPSLHEPTDRLQGAGEMKKKKCHICGKEILSNQSRVMVYESDTVKTVHRLCRDYRQLQREKKS